MRTNTGWQDRTGVLARIAAALFAGYFLAHGATAFLTLVLPLGRADRVVFASLLSFAAWTAAVIYIFAARSAWRAWWVPTLAASALLAIPLLLPDLAARP